MKTSSGLQLVLRVLTQQGIQGAVLEHRFAPPRRWRFDLAIPELLVALEVDGGIWTGGRHTRPGGFLGDCEKLNAAALAGWLVLRVTPQDLPGRAVELLLLAVEARRMASQAGSRSP